MSIDNRIETVVKRDNDDIVRIPHSKLIKENKCTEFRHIIKCQTGAGSYDELLNLRYEYLPTKYHCDEHRLLQCVCSQSISHVHYIRELSSNQTFRCGSECLKHLDDDLYRRAKQYEKEYQKNKAGYTSLLNEYITFIKDYVIFREKGTTIKDIVNKSRFESDRTLNWIISKEYHKKCSNPEIELFIEYLLETAPQDVNMEKFLLSMKIPDNYYKCNCGSVVEPKYSEKNKMMIFGCPNKKKTPTGWENACKFFKWGFKNSSSTENELFIKAQQLSINCKRLQKVCYGIESYQSKCHA
jgi:hypothetical protein